MYQGRPRYRTASRPRVVVGGEGKDYARHGVGTPLASSPLSSRPGDHPGSEMASLHPCPPRPYTRSAVMRFGIAVFPGTWSDRDCAHAVELSGNDSVMLWHKEHELRGADCVILPGGFAYGDYLRAGAVARFAPLMASVIECANNG